MSNRAAMAITYGVLSGFAAGALIALGLAGSEGWMVALCIFGGIQILFTFMAIAYTSGRHDEHHRKVPKKEYY